MNIKLVSIRMHILIIRSKLSVLYDRGVGAAGGCGRVDRYAAGEGRADVAVGAAERGGGLLECVEPGAVVGP